MKFMAKNNLIINEIINLDSLLKSFHTFLYKLRFYSFILNLNKTFTLIIINNFV